MQQQTRGAEIHLKQKNKMQWLSLTDELQWNGDFYYY